MTNVPIRIFDTSLNLVSEVDAYEQAYFTRSLTGYGEFQIVINYNVTHASDFQKNYFVLFGKNDHRIGVIENISKAIDRDGKGSQKLTITGYEAKAIFNRRIVIPASGNDYYIQDAVQETVFKNTILDQCGTNSPTARQFPLLTIATDQARGVVYQLQAFNTILSDHLTDTAEASSPYMGFELYFDETNRKLVFEVIVGKDRRQSQSTNGRVVFSSDYGSLKKATITDQNSGYKNVVYVGGQGDGSDKTIVKTYSGTEPTGLLRREEYKDSSSLQTISALTNAGTSELNSLAQAVLSIDAQALVKSQYILYTDYDLGDIVNIIEYGTSFDAQITAIEEEWENGNYDISLTFGKEAQSISSVISDTSSGLNQTNTSKGSLGWKDKMIEYAFSSSITSITQSYTEILNDTLVLTGSVSADCTLTLQKPDTSTYIGRKSYRIVNKLTASASGLYVTISAGGTQSFKLPIFYSSNTLLNGYNAFDVYVDASGNVISVDGTEIGNNSNGTYVKFANGTLICYGTTDNFTTTNGTTLSGIYYSNYTQVFPFAFFSTPHVVCTPMRATGFGWSLHNESISISSFKPGLLSLSNNYTTSVQWMAIGNWK